MCTHNDGEDAHPQNPQKVNQAALNGSPAYISGTIVDVEAHQLPGLHKHMATCTAVDLSAWTCVSGAADYPQKSVVSATMRTVIWQRAL